MRVVVLGSNIAGYSAAMELRYLLPRDIEILVVSKSFKHVFTPSLIWIALGNLSHEKISSDIRNDLDRHHINFLQAHVDKILPTQKQICTQKGHIDYDYLVIATGAAPNHSHIKGFRLGENGFSILTMAEALKTKRAWRDLRLSGGHLVLSVRKDCLCLGAAYETLYRVVRVTKDQSFEGAVPISFVTDETDFDEFARGYFRTSPIFKSYAKEFEGVKFYFDSRIDGIKNEGLHINDEQLLAYRMLIDFPLFSGMAVVKSSPELAQKNGLLQVDSQLRVAKQDAVYACGTAIFADPPSTWTVPYHTYKKAYPFEKMASVAAWNLACDIKRESTKIQAVDLDAILRECEIKNTVLLDVYKRHNIEYTYEGIRFRWLRYLKSKSEMLRHYFNWGK